MPNEYFVGPATGLDKDLYAPDGEPWCRFGKDFACLNDHDCVNPNHRKDDTDDD